MLIYKPENIQEILVSATRALGASMPYREARLQAELLLAHTLGTTRTRMLARLTDTVEGETAARFAAEVARRAQTRTAGVYPGTPGVLPPRFSRGQAGTHPAPRDGEPGPIGPGANPGSGRIRAPWWSTSAPGPARSR